MMQVTYGKGFEVARPRLSDAVWEVMKDYLVKWKNKQAPDELRTWLESNTEITPFDGGVFIAIGNEFDLFVEAERQGRWRIRSTISAYLDQMGRRYGKIVARIDERNTRSLRLARHFGFNEVSRENGVIRLEKKHG